MWKMAFSSPGPREVVHIVSLFLREFGKVTDTKEGTCAEGMGVVYLLSV